MNNEDITRAMWEGDIDKLNELAGCICCCAEHTYENCPARAWEGCRGTGTPTHKDIEEWRAFYGMTVEQFYGELEK